MKIVTSFLLVTLLAFAAAPGARAEDQPADSAAIKSKLKEMEDNWEKATVNKDFAALEGMVADDFGGMTHEGKARSKSDLLAQTKKDATEVTSAENKDMAVHVYAPNLATVYGQSVEKGKDKNGKEFTHTYAWVDTWMERDGKWQCIAEGVLRMPDKK